MKSWMNLRAFGVSIFVALSSFSVFASAPGEMFPKLDSYGLEGDLPDLKGKVVLVDFFASWCAPCRLSFPAMEELQQKYKDKGFVVVAVNVDKKKADMEKFMKKEKASFTVVRDVSARLVADVKVPTMPTSYLLDRDGKIAAVHNGYHGDETKAKYIQEIESLLR